MRLSRFGNRDVRAVRKLPAIDYDFLATWCVQAGLETFNLQVFVDVVVAVVKVRTGIETDLAVFTRSIRHPDIVEANVLGVAQLHAGLTVPDRQAFDLTRRQVERVLVEITVLDAEPKSLRLRRFAIAMLVDLKTLPRTVRLVVLHMTQRHVQRRDRRVIRNQRRIGQVLDKELRNHRPRRHAVFRATNDKRLAPENHRRTSCTGGHVAFDLDAEPVKPKSVSGATEVLIVAIFKRFAGGAVRFDRDIVGEVSDFIADFRIERCTIDVVRNVIGEVHVARMIHVAPPRTSNHDTTRNARRSGIFNRTVSMEVDRVTAAWIRAGSGNSISATVELGVIVRLRLVGSTEFIEARVIDIHITIVHEHDVAAAIDGGVFGFEDRVARVVGHVNLQVRGGRNMVEA